MKWYKHLYVGESLTEKKEKVMKRLNHNVLQPNVYVIVLAENGKDNFRILSSLELLQKGYPKEDLTVVGIAKGKEEAFLLVGQMIQDVLEKTGSVDRDSVAQFFDSRGGHTSHDYMH